MASDRAARRCVRSCLQVRRCPDASSLDYLKQCLAYCSNTWLDVFARLHGVELLLAALDTHAEAARWAAGTQDKGHRRAACACMHCI